MGPPLGPGGEDITWPDRVAPRGRKASREGTQPLPATNSCRPDGRVRAQRVPSPYRLRTAAVQMDE